MGWRIGRNIRLYGMYISAVLRGTMQYKLSFFLMLYGRFMVSFNSFLGIYFIFSGFSEIKGYTYEDVVLCFAVMQMAFSIAELAGRGFSVFSHIVRRGEFDRMLLRPCSLILQVLGCRFELGKIGPMITAVVMLIIGVQNSRICWGVGRVLTLLMMIGGGSIVFIGLFMVAAATSFFAIEDTGFVNILTYGARDHGKYPLDVYGKGIMKFCTYVIPYTLIQYYPLQYLLGKTDKWWYGLYPFGTVIFLAMCYGFWRFGLKHYKSCGS